MSDEKVEEEEKVEVADSDETVQEATSDEPVQEEEEAKSATMESFDVAIVGGGPSGSFAAYQLRRLHPKAKIVVFDCESSVGGAQVQIFDSKKISNNPKHGEWIKHAEFSSTNFDPATSTVLASIINDLGLPVKPIQNPTDSSNIFYMGGEMYGRSVEELTNSSLENHPESVVEQCIENFFLDYPEERTRPPFTSKLLTGMTLEDLLEEYADSPQQAEAALLYSGFDTFSSGSNASLAAFVDSFPYCVRKPTHSLVGGTKE